MFMNVPRQRNNHVRRNKISANWILQMKNTGVCPKCAAHDIIHVPGEKRSMTGAVGNTVAAGLLAHVLVSRFVCCDCGYSEEWIESDEALKKLKDHYGPK